MEEDGEKGEIPNKSIEHEPFADSMTSSQQVREMFEQAADFVEGNNLNADHKAIEVVPNDDTTGDMMQAHDVHARNNEGAGTKVLEKSTEVQDNTRRNVIDGTYTISKEVNDNQVHREVGDVVVDKVTESQAKTPNASVHKIIKPPDVVVTVLENNSNTKKNESVSIQLQTSGKDKTTTAKPQQQKKKGSTAMRNAMKWPGYWETGGEAAENWFNFGLVISTNRTCVLTMLQCVVLAIFAHFAANMTIHVECWSTSRYRSRTMGSISTAIKGIFTRHKNVVTAQELICYLHTQIHMEESMMIAGVYSSFCFAGNNMDHKKHKGCRNCHMNPWLDMQTVWMVHHWISSKPAALEATCINDPSYTGSDLVVVLYAGQFWTQVWCYTIDLDNTRSDMVAWYIIHKEWKISQVNNMLSTFGWPNNAPMDHTGDITWLTSYN
ncbi:hypothetical protein K7X08_023306 [Anisodus acutangulus]|uniref:Uncharacterized protein n=1 Tax=Anisodus acutangulus TaxID=402998 RepID=A0A9Q1LHW8_9SOLA|nr:hypothetical protein K7X08_023306 [Anisodus acutangulus]